MSGKQTLALIVGVIFVIVGTYAGSAPKRKPSALNLQKTEILKDLDNPWDLAITSEGHLFFSEKCKGLSLRKSNGQVFKIFGIKSYQTVAADLFCEGQSGAHGIALDPQFQTTRQLFFFMASEKEGKKTNRVVRLTLSPDLTQVVTRTDIITNIAFKSESNSWGGAGSHSGGRLRFGPDGFLYVTTGDNHNGSLPQDLNHLGGKVLRVDKQGKAAPGNKTPPGGDPRIFTYGHRNVQGLTFHPKTGEAIISEHGPGHSDEVTILKAGGNAGWDPKPEKGVSCDDDYCGYTSNKRSGALTPMTDLAKFSQALQPIYKLENSEGMGPCTFLTGEQWKSWNGALLVGIMRGQRVEVLQLEDNGHVVGKITADLPRERYRSIVQGPDGALYIATDGGEIWKVTP